MIIQSTVIEKRHPNLPIYIILQIIYMYHNFFYNLQANVAGPTQTVVIHQNTNLLSKGDKLVILVNFQRPNRGCYCHQSYWNQKRNNPRQRQPPNFSKMGPNFDVVLDVLIHWLVENCRHLLTMPLRFVFTIFQYVLYRLFFYFLNFEKKYFFSRLFKNQVQVENIPTVQWEVSSLHLYDQL